MTITLAAIKAEQSRLAAMIATFAKQQSTSYVVPGATIELAPGERYAGIVLADDGEPLHHLVLLPGQIEDADWDTAKAWAAQQGGELPSRREQSLLYANLKSEFEGAPYWSAEAHGTNSSCAWCQVFTDGGQDSATPRAPSFAPAPSADWSLSNSPL